MYSLYKIIKEYAIINKFDVIMHFPHSSLDLPESIYKDSYLDKDELNQLTLKMGDVLLLELFKYWDFEKVIAKYSRIYVDVEKYWNHDEEVMSKYGMGAIYTKDLYGRKLHKCSEDFMKEAKDYYDRYHNNLKEKCKGRDVLILDIHSFNDEMANVFSEGSYPDICVGYNDGDKDDVLISLIHQWCSDNNISYMDNYPYSGSMSIDNKDNRIISIMLEINKKYYL